MKVCHNLIIVGKPDNPEFTQSKEARFRHLFTHEAIRAAVRAARAARGSSCVHISDLRFQHPAAISIQRAARAAGEVHAHAASIE